MPANKETNTPDCASCPGSPSERLCVNPQGKAHKGCPTVSSGDLLEQTNQSYLDDPEMLEFARQASIQEAEGYANRHQRPYVLQPCKTRLQEICEFAERMGYKRLGLAFCVGLAQEAAQAAEIFKNHGFEVVSAACKAGRTLKDFIGLGDEHQIFQGRDEAMCNPLYQAALLNHHKTEFNVLLGLCVGHDSMFLKRAEAPSTVLAAKDRVTGHNPLAALYTKDSYYMKITKPGLCDD